MLNRDCYLAMEMLVCLFVCLTHTPARPHVGACGGYSTVGFQATFMLSTVRVTSDPILSISPPSYYYAAFFLVMFLGGVQVVFGRLSAFGLFASLVPMIPLSPGHRWLSDCSMEMQCPLSSVGALAGSCDRPS